MEKKHFGEKANGCAVQRFCIFCARTWSGLSILEKHLVDAMSEAMSGAPACLV
jgi:hypothetical protein